MMRTATAWLCCAPALAAALAPPKSGVGGPNMNGEYVVQHGTTQKPMKAYSEQGLYPKSEFFDVYSPQIKTLYGQVYWTMMEGTPLPPDIVSRFNKKTMAVVGYECNQIAETADGKEYPIPINAAYNHHHGSYLKSSNAVLKKVPAPPGFAGHMDGDGSVWYAEDQRPQHLRTGPASTTFHEGNGGEYRKSYHGYPKGHAQLVESPASFHLQPMQIDTWNRSNVNATTGGPGWKFVAGIQPKNSAQLSPEAAYSGLLECPCTDRITKQITGEASTRAAGICPSGGPTTLAACKQAALSQLGSWGGLDPEDPVDPEAPLSINASSGSDATKPPGCSVTVEPIGAGPEGRTRPSRAGVFFNTLSSAQTTVACGGGGARSKMWGASLKTAVNNVGMFVSANASHLEITATGPAGVWYGVGLNATTMSALPWTLVVDGTGKVSAHRLADHAAGTRLPAKLNLISNLVSDGRRTVVVTAPLPTSFDLEALHERAELAVITAVGSGPKFAYHKKKAVATVTMAALGAPTCLCDDATSLAFGQGKGKLLYTPVADEPGGSNSKVPGAPATSLGFAKDCLPYPGGTMLLEKNPTCDLRAYTGGQSCCHHMFTLLDRDQKTPDQDKFLVYRMKWRFWFQEVETPSEFQDLSQFNWGGMASPTEYDVPKCGDGVFGCTKGADGHWTHTMNGTWTVGQMRPSPSRSGEPEPQNASGVRFIALRGHCHAPTCIQFDLFNADTGDLICTQRPLYGDGGGGDFQEEGYINVPPCIFGSEAEGLPLPPGGMETGLPMGTKLFSKKVCHADYAHHGEMSLWQSYGELVA